MWVEGGFFFSKSVSVTSRLKERWEYAHLPVRCSAKTGGFETT